MSNKLHHFFINREDIFLHTACQYNLQVFDDIATTFIDLNAGFLRKNIFSKRRVNLLVFDDITTTFADLTVRFNDINVQLNDILSILVFVLLKRAMK